MKISRRGLLKGIGLGAGFAAVGGVAAKIPEAQAAQGETYGGSSGGSMSKSAFSTEAWDDAFFKEFLRQNQFRRNVGKRSMMSIISGDR